MTNKNDDDTVMDTIKNWWKKWGPLLLFKLGEILKKILIFITIIVGSIFFLFLIKNLSGLIAYLIMLMFKFLNQPIPRFNLFNADLTPQTETVIKQDPPKLIQDSYYLEQQKLDIQKRSNQIKTSSDELRLAQKKAYDKFSNNNLSNEIKEGFKEVNLNRRQAYQKFDRTQDKLDDQLVESDKHILKVIMKNQKVVRPENYLSDERKTAYWLDEYILKEEKIALDQLELDLLQVDTKFERLDKKIEAHRQEIAAYMQELEDRLQASSEIETQNQVEERRQKNVNRKN